MKPNISSLENCDPQEVLNVKNGGRGRNSKKSSKLNKTISDVTMTRMLLDTPNGSRAKRYAIRQSIAVDGLLTRTSFYPSRINSKAQDKKSTTSSAPANPKGVTLSVDNPEFSEISNGSASAPTGSLEKSHVTFSSKIPTLTPHRNAATSAQQSRKSLVTPTPSTGSKIPRPILVRTPMLMSSEKIPTSGASSLIMNTPAGSTPRALPNYMRPTMSSLNKSSPSKHIFLAARKSEHLMPSAPIIGNTTTTEIGKKRKSEFISSSASATPLGKYEADLKRRKMLALPWWQRLATVKNDETRSKSDLVSLLSDVLKTANSCVETNTNTATKKPETIVAKKAPKLNAGMRMAMKSENMRSVGTRQSNRKTTVTSAPMDKEGEKVRARSSDVQTQLNETFTLE